MTQSFPLNLDAVRAAHERIRPSIHRTPVLTCSTLDRLAGVSIFFKCENFQKVGAFKFRGACNAVLKLDDETAAKGVVTHSSGNHAQALALAARNRNIPAYIVMPRTASAIKRAAVRDYGASIIDCEPTLQAREEAAQAAIERTGGTLVPPYDSADVIAGQGTATLELLEEVGHLDVIVTPVGGGGLISGTAIAAHGIDSKIRVIAGEPTGADDAARSKASGRWMAQNNPKTIADGLMTSLGRLNWPIIRDQVEQIITVDDPQIVAAMRLLWERAKLLIEPSSAVALAAVLSDSFRGLTGVRRVGIILSGGNVNLDQLPWISKV